MDDVFIFVVLMAVVTAVAVAEAKKSMRKKEAAVRKPAGAHPSAQTANAAPPAPSAPAPAASALSRPASFETYSPGFVSLEGQGIETEWHDAGMTGEGTDPCHDEMYFAPVADREEAKKHAERPEVAREWAKAVVMAEIMKRPSERRWRARGRS